MKFWILLIVSLLWLVTWVLNMGTFMGSVMMTDAVNDDAILNLLILMGIIITSTYFISAPIAIIVAWIAYFSEKTSMAQTALATPLIHIAIFVVNMFLFSIWQAIA